MEGTLAAPTIWGMMAVVGAQLDKFGLELRGGVFAVVITAPVV